jgi:metal-sulfur cluster biosynthetic enzyme
MEQKLQQEVINILKTVIDPEVGINVWDFGLIYGVLVKKALSKKPVSKSQKSNVENLKEEKALKTEKNFTEKLPKNSPTLELVKNLEEENYKNNYTYNCHILMTFTSVNCPAIDALLQEIREKINHLFESVEIEIVWEPRWDASLLTEEIQFELGLL